MKIYVVTRGSYSDYGISKVFLNKEKAEKYVSLSQADWDAPRIETYETSDEVIIDKITYVEVDYVKDEEDETSLDIEIKVTNSMDSTEEEIVRNDFYLYPSGTKELNIRRVIKDEYDEDVIKNKYEKVTYDVMAEIESLIEIEGWTERMIEEWLGKKFV